MKCNKKIGESREGPGEGVEWGRNVREKEFEAGQGGALVVREGPMQGGHPGSQN